jgi:hypothetical protein
MLIEEVIKAAGPGGKAYVFVSSTRGTGKELLKNPLTSDQKMPILTHMFPDGTVEFVNTGKCDPACGGASLAFKYLIDKQGHTADDITLVVGKDREDVFGKDAKIWSKGGPAGFVFLESGAIRDSNIELTDAANMSGTKARHYVKLGRKDDFYSAVGYAKGEDTTDADAVFEAIANPTKPGGRRSGGGETPSESVFGADDEVDDPAGGRRRTRHRKRGLRRKTRRNRA